MQITGIIRKIKDTEQVSESFCKREVWVHLADLKYPQVIPVEFTQTRAALLNGFSVDQEVTITFDFRGRVWQDKCFVTLNGFEIKPSKASEPYSGIQAGDMGKWGEFLDWKKSQENPEDNLPF